MIAKILFVLFLMVLLIIVSKQLRFTPKKGNHVEKLVQCANCKTYISGSRAIKRYRSNETIYFCSKKCEREYKQKRKEEKK
ncbi:MAG: hypothetical protein J7J10_02630 [Deltaproteobacteria bacterium]|nr:hypothetical protein [Deltaproteobacteria bacterium]